MALKDSNLLFLITLSSWYQKKRPNFKSHLFILALGYLFAEIAMHPNSLNLKWRGIFLRQAKEVQN